MCCFTRPVQSVSQTSIFARDAGKGQQFLVYSMSYRAAEDLAMILPLPVPAGSKEDAVAFINLKDYPEFFTDLRAGFPEPVSRSRQLSKGPIAAAAQRPLDVVQVGSFEASFVPAVKDFARLDARFRLPEGVWDQLPAYQRYGFAVFKLRKDAESVHPMAFSFPRADPRHLFFPTVHIHDGKVHAEADFDHSLYCQLQHELNRVVHFRESPQLAASFVNPAKASGIIDGHGHCYLMVMKGRRKNQDTLV